VQDARRGEGGVLRGARGAGHGRVQNDGDVGLRDLLGHQVRLRRPVQNQVKPELLLQAQGRLDVVGPVGRNEGRHLAAQHILQDVLPQIPPSGSPPSIAACASCRACRSIATPLARVPGLSKRACASGPSVKATVVIESRREASTVVPAVENVAVCPLMRAPGAWPVWTVVKPSCWTELLPRVVRVEGPERRLHGLGGVELVLVGGHVVDARQAHRAPRVDQARGDDGRLVHLGGRRHVDLRGGPDGRDRFVFDEDHPLLDGVAGHGVQGVRPYGPLRLGGGRGQAAPQQKRGEQNGQTAGAKTRRRHGRTLS